jgi:hypothetical protein
MYKERVGIFSGARFVVRLLCLIEDQEQIKQLVRHINVLLKMMKPNSKLFIGANDGNSLFFIESDYTTNNDKQLMEFCYTLDSVKFSKLQFDNDVMLDIMNLSDDKLLILYKEINGLFYAFDKFFNSMECKFSTDKKQATLTCNSPIKKQYTTTVDLS